MNRIPDFQTDMIFSNTPAPAEATEVSVEGGHGDHTTATTTQPVPLAPPHTGVLHPINGGQIFALILFAVLAAGMLVAMTRYGRNNNYGD